MTTITFEAVKAVLEEIRDSVDADFKYDKFKPGNWAGPGGETVEFNPEGGACVYRNRITNEPACIVGRALDKLGVLPEDTARLEGKISMTVTAGIGVGVGASFSIDAENALQKAQNVQDNGGTWHDAIDRALS